jgi:hypothetical protein
MFSSKQIRSIAMAALLLLTTALSAQHSVGRDHHVFHRPPPAPPQHHVSQTTTVMHGHVSATPAASQNGHSTHPASTSVVAPTPVHNAQ